MAYRIFIIMSIWSGSRTQKGRIFDGWTHILLTSRAQDRHINQRHACKEGDRSARLRNCSKNTHCVIFEDDGKFPNNFELLHEGKYLNRSKNEGYHFKIALFSTNGTIK